MQAAQITEYGGPETLRVVETPRPITSLNHVVVKVTAAGLNPKDCLVRKGKFHWFTGKDFPLGVGYDFAGIVSEVGPGATKFAPGERVYGFVGGWRGSSCAEYVAVHKDHLAMAPKNLSLTQSSAYPIAALTALQALRDDAQAGAGQSVCLNGASGGVGTFAIQIAKILGLRVTTVSSGRNLTLCEELGADEVIDYQAKDITKLEKKFDIFFDIFGNYTFGSVKGTLKDHGYYVSTVPRASTFVTVFLSLPSRRKCKVVMVKPVAADLKQLAEWTEAGRLRPVIDRSYPLERIAEAQSYIETKRARGKVVITIENEENTGI